jgi:hypothetical protein
MNTSRFQAVAVFVVFFGFSNQTFGQFAPPARGIPVVPHLFATESYAFTSGGLSFRYGYFLATPARTGFYSIAPYSSYSPVNIGTARAIREARRNNSVLIPASEPRNLVSEITISKPLADPFAGLPTAFRTAVTNASEDDIKSGRALNDILATISDLDKRGYRADGSYLAPELFPDIRFAGTATGDLTNWIRAGEIEFPELFHSDDYAIPRAWLRHDFGTAAGQLRNGKTPESAVALGLQTALRTIRRTFDEKKSSLTPAELKLGEQYLARLDAAIAIVRAPAIAELIVPEWNSLGSGIVEFTQHLARHRLQFGPAQEGRDESYRTLHHALSAYAVSLAELRR